MPTNPELKYPLGTDPSNPTTITELVPSATPFAINDEVAINGVRWYRFLSISGGAIGIGTNGTNGDVLMQCHAGVHPSLLPMGPRGQDDILIQPGTTYLSVEDSGGSRVYSLKALSLS
jgi:hypothetical protein